MARNMSFALTIPQFLDQSKTVTRRNGWLHLKKDEKFWGVEKAMGFKKGEKIKRLGLCRVVSIRREPLNAITQADVIAEGFPDWTPEDFIKFYAKANRCAEDTPVTRIEFEYLEE